ncbi:hypothetical protein GX51_02602 [Blastomyces parvus]|uniref:DUF7730 domain-containing protein n=1 Tax=Blastomyces parvus TaxID=2060905 RepID=A0A2B7XB64_9EURO|nr:hypothetical protein GX51_02602 [Blastomyces parvus]
MVVDVIKHVLKVVLLTVVQCLLLPVYPCFIAKFAAEKAADERKAEGLMVPIVGLAPTSSKPDERRRLSITPSMLEEGHPNGHANNNIAKGATSSSSDAARSSSNESPSRVARLLSKRPRIPPLSHFFSFAPSPSPPAAGPAHLNGQQSLFLARLPLEIRLAIYHHALACHRVHLVRVPGKVASVACAEGVEIGYTCFKGGREDYACLPASVNHPWVGHGPISFGNLPQQLEAAPVTFADGVRRGVVGALDLLSVCRQVYAEAIAVLYKRLTFQMDLITLLAFSISIPEHHLKAITKLEISGPRLNYIDSAYYLQYLPSFRQIRRPSSSSSHSSSSSSSSTTTEHANTTLPPQTLYKINRKLTSFTRYRAQDIPVYTPRPPTAWEETCARLLPRLTGLCALRISLKRPWPFAERCMSPAAERYLLQPLAEAVCPPGGVGGTGRLPLLRVFEVRVDWEEGVEGHGWEEKGVWPALKGEGEGEGEGDGGTGTEEVDMWRPSAFLLESGSRAALLEREGWEVWGDERWASYLVREKRKDKRGGEGEVEEIEEVDGDGYEDGYEEQRGLWQDAPFTVIRSFGASSESRLDSR